MRGWFRFERRFLLRGQARTNRAGPGDGPPPMTRCSICANPQVSEVDVLLSTGTSIRKVSQLYGLSRSTLVRHKAHLQPTGSKFGVIRGEGGPDGPGDSDPLSEALLLAERARTPRERLRALEQVRAATKLKLRGVQDLDLEDRELLDRNIAQAEAAYRNASDFETAARALSGWREALHRRLDAMRIPETIEVPVHVTYPGAEPQGDPATVKMRVDTYFSGVPMRFRDPDRFTVDRTLRLRFGTGPADEVIKMYDASGALVWASG